MGRSNVVGAGHANGRKGGEFVAQLMSALPPAHSGGQKEEHNECWKLFQDDFSALYCGGGLPHAALCEFSFVSRGLRTASFSGCCFTTQLL